MDVWKPHEFKTKSDLMRSLNEISEKLTFLFFHRQLFLCLILYQPMQRLKWLPFYQFNKIHSFLIISFVLI